MMRSLLKTVLPLLIALCLNMEMAGSPAPGAGVTAPEGHRDGTGAPEAVHKARRETLGSGDGRIRVIPALSAPSVKNGGKLTIQAVVSARAGVAKVEAEIEGVVRLELKPATGIFAPLAHDRKNRAYGSYGTDRTDGVHPVLEACPGGAALYQAEWTARGLEEKVYPVALRVTDRAGHVHVDRSLSFSDPAAGNSTVGSTAYPIGFAPRQVSERRMVSGEGFFESAVIDPAGQYAYFGAGCSVPGVVIKVRLSDLTCVGKLILNWGEVWPDSAVIDPAGNYAYFGTSTSPGIIVKVRLSDFTRVGALTLNAGENYLNSAVIDPSGTYAYFGTLNPGDYNTPGRVVKVHLADMKRMGALTLNAKENNFEAAVMDPAGNYAYFGTHKGVVVKIRLTDFTRVGALSTSGDLFTGGAIDPAGACAYFEGDTWPPCVIKVRLSDFTEAGSMELDPGTDSYGGLLIDPQGQYAYFGGENYLSSSSGFVVKVRLSDFKRVGILVLSAPYSGAVIASSGSTAYFGTLSGGWGNEPGHVVRVRLSDFTVTGDLMVPGEDNLSCGVIDQAAGYAYFGTDTAPGRVVKVRLSDNSRVGALTLNPGEEHLKSAVIDTARGFAYFGDSVSSGTTGKVIKVRLSDLTRVGALDIPDAPWLATAVIDSTGGYAYFGAVNANPNGVVRVRLSDFSYAGKLVPNSGGTNWLTSAVIDPAGGFAYFGSKEMLSAGKIIKVRLSDFTHAGTLTLNSGENDLWSAMIDPAGGHAYFSNRGGGGASGPKLIKVRLSDFTRVGALTLNDGFLCSGVIDPASGHAYLGAGHNVVKVRLSDLTRMGALALTTGTEWLSSAVLDPAAGNVYFGTLAAPGRVIKVALNCKNALRANRVMLGERGEVQDVRFYSHTARGNLRLAIYGNEPAPAKTLLWESASTSNTAAGGWITIPISKGTPSRLTLPPGQYWLAWQSDSTADVPSYMPGTAGEGFSMERPYGPFPATLASGAILPNIEKWSEYLTYVWQNAVLDWRMYR